MEIICNNSHKNYRLHNMCKKYISVNKVYQKSNDRNKEGFFTNNKGHFFTGEYFTINC